MADSTTVSPDPWNVPYIERWTTDTTHISGIHPFITDIPVINIPIDEANSYYNIQQPLDIEAIMSLLNGVKQGRPGPDPVQINYLVNPLDRENAPEKPIFICFDTEEIKIFEEDAGGSRHLRAAIKYDKINSIHAVSKNKLLTVQEVDTLDLNVELRNTQASLSETATALREARGNLDLRKDQELAQERISRNILDQKYQLAMKTLKLQEELVRDKESELAHIKKQIADRAQALAHLELEYGD